MEDNKYLEKVLIYNCDNLIGEYIPLTNKRNCQLISLANNFESVNINNIITANKTSLFHMPKYRKDKPCSIKLTNSEIKLFKNRRFDEYVLFLCQTPGTISDSDIYLDLSKHNLNKKPRKEVKRKRPKNYRNLIGVNNIFEERIRDKLKQSLPSNISVNAIFRTEIPETPKMFLTQNVKNFKDINSFIEHVKHFNGNRKQLVNFCIPLKRVQAIIIINKSRKEMFVELTDKIALQTQVCISELIEYHKKQYVNSKHLNIKLCRIRCVKSTKDKLPNSNISIKYSPSKTNSVISIQEFTVNNIKKLMDEYEHNLAGYTSFSSPVDNIIKETYKMLVELQLNAVDQCNQLFLNYFVHKKLWSHNKVAKFNENIKTHYALLLQLQNKAIENSIFVNKRIQNVNKFLNIIRDKTVRQCFSHHDVNNNNDSTNLNNINLKDYDADMQITLSLTTVQQTHRKEIEVQTSVAELTELLDRVMSSKGCSTRNLSEVMDKKCVQTDISINKNTSIDFGGKQIQICRKNINLKTNHLENKPDNISISDSEKEMLHKLIEKTIKPEPVITMQPEPVITMQPKPVITITHESVITKSIETSTTPNEITPKNSESKDDLNLEQEMAQLTNILNRIKAESSRPKSTEVAICPKSREVAVRPKGKIETVTTIEIEKEQKKAKLNNILKQIQAEHCTRTNRPISAGTPALCTIHEENFKVPTKNHQVMYHIKNTLDLVKDRFEKNSLILRKVSDWKDNYFVSNNIKSLMETGVTGDFPGKPKFIKLSHAEPVSSSTTVKSVNTTKQVIAMNLNTSLLLLKNLNEVTKNLKTDPVNAMSRLNEIEQSIEIQKKLIPKVQYNKMQLTLTPIKNFIASNKMQVTNNATRVPTQTKKSRIMPTVNSKHVIDLSRLKKQKKRRPAPSKTTIQTVSTVNMKSPKIQTTAVATRDTAPVPKIYRPVNTNTIIETPKLSNLTLVDVAPLQPEYPRKDNLSHIDIEKTYLYKLINNSFSDKNLEPAIQCSNVNCVSCTSWSKIQNEKKEKRALKRRDYFKKNEIKDPKNYVWEKMNWNNGITVQADHDFDFNQYMDDPNLKRQQDVVVCPVNVQYNRKNNEMRHKVTTAVKKKNNTVSVVSTSHVTLKPTSKVSTSIEQNKIQRSIQQAIMRNQEKFKFIQQSLVPKNNYPKHKAYSTAVPKIISTGTIQKQKLSLMKLPASQRMNECACKPRIADDAYDKRHKQLPSIIPTDNSKHQDAILETISKTVKRSTDDMQRYIELVEQKFIKTFSMPETEKATAYTNLESEIKGMLHLLNATKSRRGSEDKTETVKPKQIKQMPEKMKPVKARKRPINKCSNVSVIVIKEPGNFGSGSEMAVDKKKNIDGSQPTICTDSISFSSSLAAIVSKQNVLFPVKQKSSSILKNAASSNGAGDNLKNSASVKSVASSKRVRFNLSDSTIDISDEEYSTLCEETVSSVSSEMCSKRSKPYIDISILVCLQVTSHAVFPTCVLATYYIIQHYQLVQFKLDPDFDWPENYELKILCKKNTLELLQIESNFAFDDLNPNTKDSLSDFIENCEEIIQATKKLDLERKSDSDIFEFLDILQSISVENLVVRVDVYVQFSCQDVYLKYFANTYYIIGTYHSMTLEQSKDLKFSELFELFKPKQHEPNYALSELSESKWKVVPFTKPNSKLIPYKKMSNHFSEPTLTNDLLKYNIKLPFCNDLMASQSETRCLEGPTYISRSNFETVYQTLVLNLQVLNCGRKPISRHFSRKTIRKKCHSPPTKNTLQLKRYEVKFDLNQNTFLCINEPHKVFLVFLYVTIFSFAFLCMTLNYRCE